MPFCLIFRNTLVRCRSSRLKVLLAAVAAVGWASPSAAQFDLEREPTNYPRAPHQDRAGTLQSRLERGTARLDYDPAHGYLPALLRELGISEKTQTLVFSKTSFQRSLISPKRPRAIYYNDDSYVGWIPDGEVIEISSVDRRLGPIFYTLEQKRVERPRLVRQSDDCLQCHVSPMTQGVPGHLVRSVFPSSSGNPILSAGSFRTTYQSPLRERWGGWYVTGTHGAQRHMGNSFLRGTDPERFDRERGANVTDLAGRFDLRPYLSVHSDLVALLVLEHQVPTHNQITLSGWQALLARRDQEVLNQMDGKPVATPIESIERRYRAAGDDVLRCLLLAGEARLMEPVRGTSGFVEQFAALGPRDKQGRSLRQLDLRQRLFRYPCSFLIYSDAFEGLPGPVKAHVYQRLWRILTGREDSAEFSHLSAADRRAIYEILRDTKTDLPASW